MNFFSSIFVIPENQHAVATPSDFCFNEFGLNNPDLPVEAVRLSRVINKLTEAFKDNDSILNGFLLSNFSYKYDQEKKSNLKIDISRGEAIIDNTIIELPYDLNISILSPDKNIPISIPDGRLILYLYFQYSSDNNIDRPIRQNHERYILNKYPLEQVTFNPYTIRWSLYDEKTSKIIFDPWNKDDHVIVLTSQIYYSRDLNDPAIYNFWINQTENNNLKVIFDDGTEKIYTDQSGGLKEHITIVDGGDINEETEIIIPPTGIHSIYNKELKYNTTSISDLVFTNENDSYVFYNGVCYSKNCNDYKITNNTQINFINPKILEKNSVLQVFENLATPSINFGYLKNILNTVITPSMIDPFQNALKVNGLSKNKKYIVILNGLTYQDNIDYIINDNLIIFRSHISLVNNESIIIIEIIEGNLSDDEYKLKLIYDDVVINTSKKQNIYGLNPEYSYLVWYNGLLYRSSTDYYISKNIIEFRKLTMISGNSLKIIQI